MFAASGGEGRRMLVLLDTDDAGEGAKKRLADRLFGDDSGARMLGGAVGLPEKVATALWPVEQ
jgi:hypothetical protein